MENKKFKEAIELIKKGNTYLYFGSTWCGDCVVMKPIVEKVEKYMKENNINIRFIECDAEESGIFRNPDTKFKVEYVPTHLLIKNDRVYNTLYEIQTEEFLIEQVLKLINN